MSTRTPPPMYTAPPFVVRPVTAIPIPPGHRNLVFRGRRAAGTGVQAESDPGGARHAATWSQEGDEESPAVRAHQGLGSRPGCLRGRGRGDRGSDGQQGARAQRRGPGIVRALTVGHLVWEARRNPQPPEEPSRTDAGSALRGGEGAEHPRPLADDEGRASARARRSTLTAVWPARLRVRSSR